MHHKKLVTRLDASSAVASCLIQTITCTRCIEMDLFEYFPDSKVLICRLYKHAIPRKAIKTHLQRKHRGDHHDLQGKDGPALIARKLLSRPDIVLLDPAEQKLASPKPDSDALPFLELHVGYQCKKCPKILCDTKSIVKHLRKIHDLARRGPGRPRISSQRIEKDWTQVACQRFFTSRHQSTYFKVLRRRSQDGGIWTLHKILENEGRRSHPKA